MTSAEIQRRSGGRSMAHELEPALLEIAFQLAVANEREAEAAPSQIVQRIREFSGRLDNLEAYLPGAPADLSQRGSEPQKGQNPNPAKD
jgi:hypothetical protein